MKLQILRFQISKFIILVNVTVWVNCTCKSQSMGCCVRVGIATEVNPSLVKHRISTKRVLQS